MVLIHTVHMHGGNQMTKAVYRVMGTFSASHKMPGHSKCENLHGHNYTVEVFLTQSVMEESTLQVDLTELKASVREIIEIFDHTHLNDILDFPSCEQIALSIISRLHKTDIYPSSVRIWETPLQWVEIYPE